jgi:DNA-binding SARP family transcriptional activator
MPVFMLRLMGPVSLVRLVDGAEVEIRLSGTSQALLALVAMQESSASMSRDAIAEMLWPETPPERSRGRLNTALWRLRGSLGEGGDGLLIERGGWIGIAPDSVVAIDFRDLVGRVHALSMTDIGTWTTACVAALEAAISARRGSFLDGIEGEWTYLARQTLTDVYEAGLEVLIRFHRHRGNLGRSIDAARRLVRDDPYREDIHAMLVELYALKGQRGRAISQYINCRDILQTDLGVAPSRELRASLDEVLDRHSLSRPELREIVRTMNQTIGLLARHLDDLRTILDDRRNDAAE